MLYKYNDFVNENSTFDSLVISDVNELVNNDKFVNAVNNILNNLPSNIKDKLEKFLSNKVDIDKIYKIEKKLNIVEKVKNLYDKGVTNIKDIFNRISPKNEGIFTISMVIFTIIFLTLAAISIGLIIKLSDQSFLSFVLALFLVVVLGLGLTVARTGSVIASASIEYVINGESEHLKIYENEDGERSVLISNKDITIEQENEFIQRTKENPTIEVN